MHQRSVNVVRVLVPAANVTASASPFTVSSDLVRVHVCVLFKKDADHLLKIVDYM
jgi:hypothetical protein